MSYRLRSLLNEEIDLARYGDAYSSSYFSINWQYTHS